MYMNNGSYQEKLDSIDQGENEVASANLEQNWALKRFVDYVDSVAGGELNLDFIDKNPGIETGLSRDEIEAGIKRNREALMIQVEQAIAERKAFLSAQDEVEIRRSQLFSNDGA
jgi:hypothetical protein